MKKFIDVNGQTVELDDGIPERVLRKPHGTGICIAGGICLIFWIAVALAVWYWWVI